MADNPVLCGALGSFVSEMLGMPLDPAVSAGICSYMTTSQGSWLYRIVQGMLGHFGRVMMFPQPTWYLTKYGERDRRRDPLLLEGPKQLFLN